MANQNPAMAVLRRLLNLPDEGETFWRRRTRQERRAWRAEQERQQTANLPPAPATEPDGATNPWERAAARAAPPRGMSGHNSSGDDVAPWARGEIGDRSTRWWQRGLRILVVIVLVLLVISGLRNWFGLSGNSGASEMVAPPPVPAQALYPTTAAAGLALRFAGAYGSWDEAKKDERAENLARLWTGDTDAGWNGRGRQQFTGLTVADVTVTAPTKALITVTGTVTPWAKDGDTWVAQAEQARPAGLAVPVVADGDLLTISETPMWVAPAVPAGAAENPLTSTDSQLSTATRASVEEFFARYAEDSDLGSVTAPGSTLRGLGGAAVFERVERWDALPADGDSFTGRAYVVWRPPGTNTGALIRQAYDLTLQRTAAGGASRWQVLDITPI